MLKQTITCSLAAVVIGAMVLITTNAGRHITPDALTQLVDCESCRLDVYPDPVSKSIPYTVGVGATRDMAGRPFKNGEQIAIEDAQKLLARDVLSEERCVSQNFNGEETLENGEYVMPQTVFEALVSLEHTVGCVGISYGKKGYPTRLRQHALRHDYTAVCEGILQYNKAGGVVNKGIVKRRNREYKWCIKGVNTHVEYNHMD